MEAAEAVQKLATLVAVLRAYAHATKGGCRPLKPAVPLYVRVVEIDAP